MASDSDGDNDLEYDFMEGDGEFLKALCKQYTAFNRTPLALPTLKLGWQVGVSDDDDTDFEDESSQADHENYLDFLFHQEELQTLHTSMDL